MSENQVPLVVPTSRDDAVEAFGDGIGVTVHGGGTIVVPEAARGRSRPQRVLMLHRAGLGDIAGGKVLRIGAMATLDRVHASAPEPLASACLIADREVRGQATVGGNLSVRATDESPRGDLQAPLIALSARVRSAGRGGEALESVEDFLARDEPRLVLEVEVEPPERGAYVAQRRRHAHTYAAMAVAAARGARGVRVAVTGGAAHGVACPSVERALADGAAPAVAADAVLEDVELRDDALATAWYRARVLPVLVGRALQQLEDDR